MKPGFTSKSSQSRSIAAALALLLAASGFTLAQEAHPAPSFQLQMNVDRLLIPVMVRDRQGHTVGDLKREDFRVFDNGKPRDISAFTVERRGGTVQHGADPAAPATEEATAVSSRMTVFLFDDMHLTAEDLAHARNAGMKVMDGALTGTDRAAVVSVSGSVNTGLTRDRDKLKEALEHLLPHSIYRADAIDCPSIDYYEADLIENKHDPVAVQDAVRKYINCHPAISSPGEVGSGANSPNAESLVDASVQRALSVGRQDVLSTLAGISELIKRMGQVPGQRSLVFVSPGFLNVEKESLDAESRIMDLAAGSDVTVSALDARGLYTTEMTASQRSPLLGGNSLQVNAEYQRRSMNQSENVMAELADGTGGTFFHNSNDLEAGLKELTEAPETVYVLELPIGEVKHNNSFHRLEVKVDREGVQVAARRGYFVPKPGKPGK